MRYPQITSRFAQGDVACERLAHCEIGALPDVAPILGISHEDSSQWEQTARSGIFCAATGSISPRRAYVPRDRLSAGNAVPSSAGITASADGFIGRVSSLRFDCV